MTFTGSKTTTRRRRLRAAGTGAALVLAGAVAGWQANNPGPAAAAATTLELEAAAARTIGADQDSYAAIVESVSPAVVTVRAERRTRPAEQFPFSHQPFFRDFFGGRGLPDAPPERREGGLGSGVIVTRDGYVLTNHHVVDGAEAIAVELRDRRRFDATVVGTDAPSDLALLKIEAAGLTALPLGESNRVRVGDVVLAVGNPLGIGQTVTLGIISAKGRSTGLGDGSFEDFLQTDAPINRGNSGGALVNTRGELIGINSQILSPSGGNIGIGFAIPAAMARDVMEQLTEHGRVRRGMLGVTVQPVTSDVARSLDLPAVRGALVNDVQPGGAAEKAGLRRGDVIVALNGTPVEDGNALRNQVARTRPGTDVRVEVARGGTTETLSATLAELPSAERAAADRPDAPGGRFGLTVEPLSPALAAQLGLDRTKGLVVGNVDPNGAAADAGFRRGDVILEVSGTQVSTVDQLRSALEGQESAPALVLVSRGGRTLFLTLERPA